MARVKCRYCKKSIDKEKSFNPLRNEYYCNVEEYNNVMKDRDFLNKTKLLFNELFGYRVINTFVDKRISELKEGFTYQEIHDTVEEMMLDIQFSIENVNFKDENHKINYVFVIIRNSIRDIVERNKIKVPNEIVPEKQPDFVSVSKYKPKKRKKMVRDIIFDEIL